MSQTLDPSPQSAPVLAIIGGGALLAAVLVGGPALIFSLNPVPPAPAVLTSQPAQVQARQLAAASRPVVARPVEQAPGPLPVDPIRRGWDLFIAGDFPAAKMSFEPLTSGERPNSQALHGWALCVYKLEHDPRPALAAIDQAAKLAPKDEAIIYNAAVLHVPEEPMRSARLLQDYLSDPTRPLNEPMQNLLGLALSKADAKTQATPEWTAAQAFYVDYDHRLEAGRRQRRWGEQWLDPAQAQAKWANLRAATAAVDNAARAQRDAVAEANRQSFRLLDDLGDAKNDRDLTQTTDPFLKARQAETHAKEQLQQAQAALDRADKPPFTQRGDTVVPKAMR